VVVAVSPAVASTVSQSIFEVTLRSANSSALPCFDAFAAAEMLRQSTQALPSGSHVLYTDRMPGTLRPVRIESVRVLVRWSTPHIVIGHASPRLRVFAGEHFLLPVLPKTTFMC
jgi:hypothetical protein